MKKLQKQNPITNFKNIMGQCKEIFYDAKVNNLNLELVRSSFGDNNHFYCIQISDWTKKKEKVFVTLHIKEAIELKAIIDTLVYEAHEDALELVKIR